MRARDLRRDASQSRDVSLAQRWHLWSAGLVAEPPTFVPDSWQIERERDRETLLDAAAVACVECRDAVLAADAARVLAGLCDVAGSRVLERGDGHEFLLSATARLIDQLEPTLASRDPAMIVCLSSMRRCRETCRAALLAPSD